MATNYNWMHPATSKSINKTLLTDYNNIVAEAMALSKTLETYVNVNKKWADDCSDVFAKWWNASSAKSATGGNLKVDAKGNLVISNTKTNERSDGEDRIKVIVNLCGAAYFGAVCMPLRALTKMDSHIKEAGLTRQAELGANKTYIDHFKGSAKNGTIVSGDSWNNFMENNFSCTKWTHKKLPVSHKKTDVSDTKALGTLVTKINNHTTNIAKLVSTYRKHIDKIVDNTVQSQYWGLTKEQTGSMDTVIRKLGNFTETKLNSFASNLGLALSESDAATFTIAKRLKTDYDL